MQLKRFKRAMFYFKDSRILKVENVVSVFMHDKMIEVIDDKNQAYCVLLESLDFYQVENSSEV